MHMYEEDFSSPTMVKTLWNFAGAHDCSEGRLRLDSGARAWTRRRDFADFDLDLQLNARGGLGVLVRVHKAGEIALNFGEALEARQRFEDDERRTTLAKISTSTHVRVSVVGFQLAVFVGDDKRSLVEVARFDDEIAKIGRGAIGLVQPANTSCDYSDLKVRRRAAWQTEGAPEQLGSGPLNR